MDLPKLNALDLFSGIGGNSLALSEWVNTVAYCERDPFAQAVLLSNMQSGRLPIRPIWDDVQTLTGEMLPEIDLIVAGFPCQDISVAGNGKGLEGKRSGLVFEVFRLIDEIAPTFVFLENVPAIRTRGAERVVKELASLGYDCRWDCLSASDVGAPHKRERWFLLAAHAERLELWHQQRRSSGSNREGLAFPRDNGETESLAYSESIRRSERRPQSDDRRAAKLGCPSDEGVGLADTDGARLERRRYPETSWAALSKLGVSSELPWPSWIPKPAIRRGDDGLSDQLDISARSHRLRCLGNAVVPTQAREAFRRLMGLTA